MSQFSLRLTASTALVAALLAAAAPAQAFDVDAGDYQAAPPGTSLALGYYQYATRSRMNVDGGPKYTKNTSLDSNVGIARFVHYVNIGGFTVDPQILIPGGALSDGKVGGARLEGASGFGDPILAATAWFVNDKESKTWFGITPFLSLPVGHYDSGKALNLGENRWKFTMQAGLVKGFGEKFTVDLLADTTWYGDNDKAGNGSQTLKQDNSYQLQSWFRYHISPESYLGVGYSKTMGGKQDLNGVYTGSKTDVDQARVTFGTFVTPSVQLLGVASTDLHVDGGFKEDFRLNLRLLKVF